MDRWSGILKVPLHPNSKAQYRVAVSLCLSSTSKNLIIPSANAIFFNGDRVEGTGNPVVERLSDLQRIAEILVFKFGGSINAWVIEASTFNGPFAVYRDFIPSVNSWGEPKSYNPTGFPASTSTVTLLSRCLKVAKNLMSGRLEELYQDKISASCPHTPKTILLGFSKGGTVINQLVTELGFSTLRSSEFSANANEHPINVGWLDSQEENLIVPSTKECFINSINKIHYVDVGLNSPGAYLSDDDLIVRITKRLMQGNEKIHFVLHGTPRQWCDNRRVWIKHEKDKLLRLLESEARKSGGRIQVCERFYFADEPPSMQMHFEIIENLDLS